MFRSETQILSKLPNFSLDSSHSSHILKKKQTSLDYNIHEIFLSIIFQESDKYQYKYLTMH